MRGDYVRRSDLPVIPTKAMVPLGDLQTIDKCRPRSAFTNDIGKGSGEIMGLMAVAVRFSQDGFVKFTFCALGGLHRVHRFPGLQAVNPGLISRCGCLS